MQCEAAISDLDNPTTHHAMIKYVSSVSTYIDDEMKHCLCNTHPEPQTLKPQHYTSNYCPSIHADHHVQIMQCEASSSTTINNPAYKQNPKQVLLGVILKPAPKFFVSTRFIQLYL